MVSVAIQKVQDMENIVKDPNKNGTNGSLHNNGNDPYKHFVSDAFVELHNNFFRHNLHNNPAFSLSPLNRLYSCLSLFCRPVPS